MNAIPPYPPSLTPDQATLENMKESYYSCSLAQAALDQKRHDWLWDRLREAMKYADHQFSSDDGGRVCDVFGPDEKCDCGLNALRKAISEASK